ncbi:MAG: O-antigen ligase domain-containing protein [Acidobacteria bacterium]|nr:MAG: O-antigen ligase domain-containing protein [Acidobacteriota bacterium]REK10151.1 MAG: O-antigen ligase domain-containing protein [Acidobacteriota bacterium]
MIRHRAPRSRLPKEFVVACAGAAILVWAPLPFASVPETFRLALVALFGAFVALAAACGGRVFPVVAPLAWVALLGAAPMLGARFGSSWLDGVSAAPELSARLAALWLGLAAFAAALAWACRRRRARLVVALGIVSASGVQLTMAVLDRMLGGGDSIWRVAVAPAGGRLRGTYVNPDHLAFLLLLALPLVAVWAARWMRRSGERGGNPLVAAVVPLALWSLFLLGVAATGSRAALAIAAVVGALQATVRLARLGRGGRLLASLLVVAAVGLPLILGPLGEGSALIRYAESSRYDLRFDQRWTVYRTTFALWLERPLLGHGLGAFREAFDRVQPESLQRDWWHAHSDPLELLADVGLIGTVPLVLVWLALVVGLMRRRLGGALRGDDGDLAEALACSLLAGAAHCCVDFPLANPANATAYLALCAAAAGLLRAYRVEPATTSSGRPGTGAVA